MSYTLPRYWELISLVGSSEARLIKNFIDKFLALKEAGGEP